ncbi:MAG: hypothetical protein A3H34_07660 [Betaproteobacteria bacterium RIFCSPLOWO2_02_FULL_67_19]|nr:MAG: hypothetical protein A3H34_07660 [Betaproteobacteria bacterium RIFCSPLOWO2_02_FULL_67_19]
MICNLLIVSLTLLPFQTVQAGMIGADQVSGTTSAQAERLALQNLLGRSEIASRMQTLGLDQKVASDRVAAMTDEEVRSLSGRIDALPAGASSGWGWAVVIILAVVIWYAWK